MSYYFIQIILKCFVCFKGITYMYFKQEVHKAKIINIKVSISNVHKMKKN